MSQNDNPYADSPYNFEGILDGMGVLEIMPDGYGFLRTNHYLSGKQDVYISNAQIRRFSLRTGDYITGKVRPQRETDRYSAMLYITSVNGAAPEASLAAASVAASSSPPSR